MNAPLQHDRPQIISFKYDLVDDRFFRPKTTKICLLFASSQCQIFVLCWHKALECLNFVSISYLIGSSFRASFDQYIRNGLRWVLIPFRDTAAVAKRMGYLYYWWRANIELGLISKGIHHALRQAKTTKRISWCSFSYSFGVSITVRWEKKEERGKKTYDSFDIRDGIHAVWLIPLRLTLEQNGKEKTNKSLLGRMSREFTRGNKGVFNARPLGGCDSNIIRPVSIMHAHTEKGE